MSDKPRCMSCGSVTCPAAGKSYVNDCPAWQEAEARNARGEYLPTEPMGCWEIRHRWA